MRAAPDRLLARLHGLGHTVVIVARDGEIVGLLGLADMPRVSAKPMMGRLHALGVRRVVMLTGDPRPADPRPAAVAIATAVGVDEVHAGMMPDDKLEHIRGMRAGSPTRRCIVGPEGPIAGARQIGAGALRHGVSTGE